MADSPFLSWKQAQSMHERGNYGNGLMVNVNYMPGKTADGQFFFDSMLFTGVSLGSCYWMIYLRHYKLLPLWSWTVKICQHSSFTEHTSFSANKYSFQVKVNVLNNFLSKQTISTTCGDSTKFAGCCYIQNSEAAYTVENS